MGFTGGYYTGGGNDSSVGLMAAFFCSGSGTDGTGFYFYRTEKRRAKLNAFGKFLHDTCNFNYLLIEKLLQALYIFLTVFSILTGAYTLFKSFGIGLVIMIGLPLLIRLIYEFLMMTVLLLKHVIMIDNKLKNQNTVDKKQQPEASVFAEPRTEKACHCTGKGACKESSSYSEASGKTRSGETGSASEVSGRKNGSGSKAGSRETGPAGKTCSC